MQYKVQYLTMLTLYTQVNNTLHSPDLFLFLAKRLSQNVVLACPPITRPGTVSILGITNYRATFPG